MSGTAARCGVMTLICGLALSGAAFAHWTATGSGSGQANPGTVSAITVNQTSTLSALAPGVPAQTLSGNFTNPNSGPVYVTSVTATVAGTDQPGCDEDDYVIAGSATVNAHVPAGSGVGSWSGLTMAFNNLPGVNQNACQGAIVDIDYTSN